MKKAPWSAFLLMHLTFGTVFSLPVEKKTIYISSLTASCGFNDSEFVVLERTYNDGSAGNIKINVFDASGNPAWERIIDRPGVGNQIAYRVVQTKDKGLAIIGNQDQENPQRRTDFFIKTDSLGRLQFEKNRGKMSGALDILIETPDSGFVVAFRGSAGNISGYPTLLKLDKNGNEIWTREYKENDYGAFTAAKITADNGMILAGYWGDLQGFREVFLVKLDSLGETEWKRTFSERDNAAVESIEPLDGGGYLLAGTVPFQGQGGSQAMLLETDANGLVTQPHFFGLPNHHQSAHSAKPGDGGWIAAGIGPNFAAMIVKTDNQGRTIWARGIGYSQGARFSPIFLGPGKFAACPSRCIVFEDEEFSHPILP